MDIEKKIKELEDRIEKLEQHKSYSKTDGWGKPLNAYDLSQRPDLKRRNKND